MAKHVKKNGCEKDVSYNELGLCVIDTILDFNSEHNWEGLCNH